MWSKKIDIKNKCIIESVEKEIIWNSMYPLLNNQQKVLLFVDYYTKCKINPKKWDIIAYNYLGNKLPLIKIIKADENDIISSSWWTLLINNIEMKNSIWNIYNFTEAEINMIMFFVKNWKLEKDRYLFFWDNINNSIDSRKFWAKLKKEFLWKFEIN